MDKRYQVFVSSTYEDLKRERQEVMHVLLELDCIPAGMELLPAANEDQWSVIKRVIDESDYYIVIIGGRYGTPAPDGVGYTEKEFCYAEEVGIPTIGFLRKDPGKLRAEHTEPEDEGKRRLVEFRNLVEKKLCKHWSNAEDLGSVVARSLNRLIKDHPAVGWIRANTPPSAELLTEHSRLRARIDELEQQITSFAAHGPPGSEQLAQGADVYNLEYKITSRSLIGTKNEEFVISRSWDEILNATLPVMLIEGSELDLRAALLNLCDLENQADDLATLDITVNPKEHVFNQVVVQLSALGLIQPSGKKRALSDKQRYWTLTPHGQAVVTRLLAVPRDCA